MLSLVAGDEGEQTTDNYDGWVLYYTQEGYAYYYNEYTGESQWADYPTAETESSQSQDPDEEMEKREHILLSPSSSQDYSDEEASVEDIEEEEFQEYLESEEGRRAYEVRSTLI
jgi:hypothetical protein